MTNELILARELIRAKAPRRITLMQRDRPDAKAVAIYNLDDGQQTAAGYSFVGHVTVGDRVIGWSVDIPCSVLLQLNTRNGFTSADIYVQLSPPDELGITVANPGLLYLPYDFRERLDKIGQQAFEELKDGFKLD
jgi:hypothetical protein